MVRFIIAALAVLSSVSASAQTLEERVKALEQKLSAPAAAPGGAAPLSTLPNLSENERQGTLLNRPTPTNQFNPALGFSLDNVLESRGDRGNFDFRSAELNLEAPVDPHVKLWTVVNFTKDEVEVEEAAVQSTSLPWSLTVRGGRLFSAFGRLAHFHDHELPFTYRPESLESIVGGEARGDGLELAWLAPLPFYTNLTLGGYNRLGAENERRTDDPRAWDEFTFMGRLHTALEVGDHTLDVGANSAWTPKRRMVEDLTETGSTDPAVQTARDTWRTVTGVDLTYRWQPSAGGVYKGLTWAVEAYQNNERRFNETTRMPRGREVASGGFSYVQFKLGRRLRPGAMIDLTENLDAPSSNARLAKTYAGWLTFDVSEFQKFRLQYTHKKERDRSRRAENVVGLQWAAIIGHHVHGFRDR